MLCYGVVCCVVLCGVGLCCVVLCNVVLCGVVLCCIVLCHWVLWCLVLHLIWKDQFPHNLEFQNASRRCIVLIHNIDIYTKYKDINA